MSHAYEKEFGEDDEKEDYLLEIGESRGTSTEGKSRIVEIASESSMASDCADYDGDDEAEDDYNDNGGGGDGGGDGGEQDQKKKKSKKKMVKREEKRTKKKKKTKKRKKKRKEEEKVEYVWKSTARNIEIVPPRVRLAKLRAYRKRSPYFNALYNSVKKVTYGEEKVRVSEFNAKETDTRYPRVKLAHTRVADVINKHKTSFNKDINAGKNIYPPIKRGNKVCFDINVDKDASIDIKKKGEKGGGIKDEKEGGDDIKDAKERGVDINDIDDSKTDDAELQVGKSHSNEDFRPTLPEMDGTDDERCSCYFLRLFSRSKRTKKDDGASKRKGLFGRLLRALGLKRSDKD